MKVAVSFVPHAVRDAVPVAVEAQRRGSAFLGIADTPHLRAAAVPTIQHALSNTSTLPIGTFVTNPVLQHPAVIAAEMAALAELHPGRVVLGIGAGDSSVRSVGLSAAPAAAVVDAVRAIRRRTGDAIRILVAASGPKLAGMVPAEADGVIIGGGLEPRWLQRMIAAAETSAGHRLERWAFAVGGPVGGAPGDEGGMLNSVVTISRHALSRDPSAREVPAELIAELESVYAGYDVGAYGDPRGANARLLDDHPRAREYLLGRFAVSGDPVDVAGRLRDVEAHTGLDGVVLTTTVVEPLAYLRDLAEMVVPALEGDRC